MPHLCFVAEDSTDHHLAIRTALSHYACPHNGFNFADASTTTAELTLQAVLRGANGLLLLLDWSMPDIRGAEVLKTRDIIPLVLLNGEKLLLLTRFATEESRKVTPMFEDMASGFLTGVAGGRLLQLPGFRCTVPGCDDLLRTIEHYQGGPSIESFQSIRRGWRKLGPVGTAFARSLSCWPRFPEDFFDGTALLAKVSGPDGSPLTKERAHLLAEASGLLVHYTPGPFILEDTLLSKLHEWACWWPPDLGGAGPETRNEPAELADERERQGEWTFRVGDYGWTQFFGAPLGRREADYREHVEATELILRYTRAQPPAHDADVQILRNGFNVPEDLYPAAVGRQLREACQYFVMWEALRARLAQAALRRVRQRHGYVARGAALIPWYELGGFT